MPEVFKHALDALERGQPATLMVVVDHRGSVPGTTGARMVVTPSGIAGTVGGGVVEKELSDRAFTLGDPPEVVVYDHHSPEVDSVCMGVQTLVVLRLHDHDRGVLEAIVSTLEADGCGVLRLSPAGVSFTSDQRRPRAFTQDERRFTYTETLGRLDTLYLVGGGHVALALSRVMATLPFRIVVLDDREHVPTMAANRWASHTERIDYARVADHIPDDPEHAWAAVMTHGHRADAQVVGLLATKDLRYLGLMGSKAKVVQIFKDLEAEGVPRECLDRVHAPIGVRIGSHTPEEIAISIAAELVQVANQRR